MAIEVRLPKLSDEMTEATISRWLKAVGESVERGEPLVEVETEKVIVEVEAPRAGVLVEIVAGEQTVVPVDGVICRIGKAGEVTRPGEGAGAAAASRGAAGRDGAGAPLREAPGQEAMALQSGSGSNVVSMPPRGQGAGSSRTTPGETVPVSPLARRVAEELGIDLTTVAGTGVGGKIVMADLQPHVEALGPAGAPPLASDAPSAARPEPPRAAPAGRPAAAPPPALPAPSVGAAGGGRAFREERLSPLRRTIARRMSEAKGPVPHFYLTSEVDVTAALALRERLNATLAEGRITVNDLMIKAAALALERVPNLNSAWSEDGVRRYEAVHIGFATAIEDGLVTPVVRDCHLKSIGRIARETAALIERARRRAITPEEMADGTFTISNLGMYDVVGFSAIINPPQAGILAIAKPVERPVADGGRVVLRKVLAATLSADHRVVDGVTGAEFLQAFKGVLEQPERLML